MRNPLFGGCPYYDPFHGWKLFILPPDLICSSKWQWVCFEASVFELSLGAEGFFVYPLFIYDV
jgi:hypothetical protein